MEAANNRDRMANYVPGSKRPWMGATFWFAPQGISRLFTRGIGAWMLVLLASAVTTRAQLTISFDNGDSTVSASSPSIILNVKNESGGALDIGGINFFITIGGNSSGPTMPTGAGQGVDLVTGTLFQNKDLGPNQFFSNPRSQGWGVTFDTSSGHFYTLADQATVKLATITFNSFPDGSYTFSLSGTSFADKDGNGIATIVPSGATVTVVPEPQHYAMAVGGLLVAFGSYRRWRRGNQSFAQS